MGTKPRSLRRRAALATAAALALAPAAGCERDGETRETGETGGTGETAAPTPAPVARHLGSPGARPEIVAMLRESDAAAYHVSDGGGRAWLERGPDQPPATVHDHRDRFRLVYEVGPHGVASGGAIHLQVSPFWGWSTPQVEHREAPGFTEVRAVPADIGFRAETLDEGLLAMAITGRPLVAGDRLEIVYGAGPAGAATDHYAERRSRFWFAVDGDGDGSRRFLSDSPWIEVLPSEATELVVNLPSVARPGETVPVRVAALDAVQNTGVVFEGPLRFVDPPPGLELPPAPAFERGGGGRLAFDVVAREPGVHRLVVEAGGLRAESNPMLVAQEGSRVLWGDLHGHTALSDGTGLPEDYFRYARDVAALDVVALTDHDHWGVQPLVRHPELWDEIRAETARFHEPGRFVTLLGFEWTSWLHGHRHVLYAGDDGPVIDSIAEQTDAPDELWAALEGHDALTVAHHSAGGPIATDWSFPPHPHFEPVTEVVSVHGSSEALDAPGSIYDPAPGNFVRDVLDRGFRLGFVGSGDSHDGHPGMFEKPYQGGLAAILSEDFTREGVLAALRARRVYATNGARILLRVAVGTAPMGDVVERAPDEVRSETLYVQAYAPAPLARVELVRSGVLLEPLEVGAEREVTLLAELPDVRHGEYVYVRVVQENGGAAWSSPIFFGAR